MINLINIIKIYVSRDSLKTLSKEYKCSKSLISEIRTGIYSMRKKIQIIKKQNKNQSLKIINDLKILKEIHLKELDYLCKAINNYEINTKSILIPDDKYFREKKMEETILMRDQ